MVKLAFLLALSVSARDWKDYEAHEPPNLAASVKGAGWNCAVPKPCDGPCPTKLVSKKVDEDEARDSSTELQCLVGWLAKYRELKHRPAKVTATLYDAQRRRARYLTARVVDWMAHLGPDGSVEDPDWRKSQQLYLVGVIHFQNGDLALAREAWEGALRVDPNNREASEGLERLKSAEQQ